MSGIRVTVVPPDLGGEGKEVMAESDDSDLPPRPMRVEFLIATAKSNWIAAADIDPEPPPGVSVRGPIPIEKYQASPAWETIGFVVNVLIGGVPSSLLAAWLYNKFAKHGAQRITIDHQEIVLKKGEIERIIQTKVEIEE